MSTAPHKAYQPIKPASSKMLAKRWDDKARDMHKKKLKNVKSTVDNKPPKTYMHLQLKLKKLQLEEERLATVERDNRLLLEKMSSIMTRKGMDNRNDYERKSLSVQKRQQHLLKIAHENQAILKRIDAKQPHYTAKAWEDDYDKSMTFKEQISRYPKTGKSPKKAGATKRRTSVGAEDKQNEEEATEATRRTSVGAEEKQNEEAAKGGNGEEKEEAKES